MSQERSGGFDPGLYLDQFNRLCARYSEETAATLLERTVHKHLAGGHAWEHFLLAHFFKRSKQGSLYNYRYIEQFSPITNVTTLTSEDQPDDDDVFDSYWRYWERRIEEGVGIQRAEDELLGLALLRRQIFAAREGSLFVWISPPGDPEEGYGPFSMLYFGSIGRWVFDKGRGRWERLVECYTYPNNLTRKEHGLLLATLAQEEVPARVPTAREILHRPLVIATNLKTPCISTGMKISLSKQCEDKRQSRLKLEDTAAVKPRSFIKPEKEFFQPADVLLMVADVVRATRGEIEATKIPSKKELHAIHDNPHLTGIGEILKPYAQKLTQAVILKKPAEALGSIKKAAEEAIMRFALPELAHLKILPGWLFKYQTSCPTSGSKKNSLDKLLGDYIPCPKCGEMVIRGSEQCPSCGTRNEGCKKTPAVLEF